MKTNSNYEIRIRGHLDARWIRQFEDLEILQNPGGETTITGLMDQAKLHGVLNRIRDLGLELIAVNQITSEEQKEEGKDS